jgi:hypothetical protein
MSDFCFFNVHMSAWKLLKLYATTFAFLLVLEHWSLVAATPQLHIGGSTLPSQVFEEALSIFTVASHHRSIE